MQISVSQRLELSLEVPGHTNDQVKLQGEGPIAKRVGVTVYGSTGKRNMFRSLRRFGIIFWG
jgi:hypothetical protein